MVPQKEPLKGPYIWLGTWTLRMWFQIDLAYNSTYIYIYDKPQTLNPIP